jgi:hypothetical protein
MREIVDGIAVTLGRKPFPARIPASLALNLSSSLSRVTNGGLAPLYQTVQKWLAEDVYDTSLIETTYGFRAQTSLLEGLKREAAWYRRRGA